MSNILNLPSEETQGRIAKALEEQNRLLAGQYRKQSDKLIKNWGDVVQTVREGTHDKVFSLRDQFMVYKAKEIKCSFTGYEESIVECTDLQAFINYIDCADPASYKFDYDGEKWLKDGEVVNLSDAGISVTDSGFVSGDTITITVISEAIYFDIIGFNQEETLPKYKFKTTYMGTTATFSISNADDFFAFVGSREEKTYTFTRINDEWVCGDESVLQASDIDGLEYNGEFTNGDVITITAIKVYTPKNSITLHTHALLPEIPFDGEEAYFASKNNLKAGTYHFYNEYENKVMQFTATKSFYRFRIGYNGKIFTYDSWNTKIIEELTATEGTTGAELNSSNGNFNNANRSLWGNNRWDLSYLRTWAHSNQRKENVYQKTHEFDLPPASCAEYMRDGFMRGLDPQFIRVLSKVVKKTALHNVDGGGYVETEDMFFPLSSTEWFSVPYYTPNGLGEGEPYQAYMKYSEHDAPSYSDDANRAMYYDGCDYDHWQRSAYYDYPEYVQCVGGYGCADDYYSANVCCCADLACVIVE